MNLYENTSETQISPLKRAIIHPEYNIRGVQVIDNEYVICDRIEDVFIMSSSLLDSEERYRLVGIRKFAEFHFGQYWCNLFT